MDGEEEIQRGIFFQVTDFYYINFLFISFVHLSKSNVSF